MPHTAASSPPLAGVRVVDFSRLLPGPWCTQTLGDLGADVVKVEQPEIGDYSRFNPPTFKSVGAYFNSVNRNKRSIVLDLADADEHPLDGPIPYVRDPLAGAGLTDPERRPSPDLGEHSEEVRRELDSVERQPR
jgi:crotonobetainyl-CoA:carnitine CoA-transferase CaiB-like acyl-CoA transferase